MRLKDVMSKNFRTISPNDTATEAQYQMSQYNSSHLVVIERSEVVGIVSAKELENIDGRFLKSRDVRDFMTPNVVTANLEMDVGEAAKLMRGNVASCLPVMDGNTLVGIVTISDLLQLLAEDEAKLRSRR